MTQTAALLDNKKVLVQYVTDKGENVALSIPEKYLATSRMTAVSAATGVTYVSRPAYLKPRHFWLNGLDQNNKLVRRKLIYNAALVPTVQDGTTVATIDGITFTASGHIGEKVRGAVNAH